MSMDIRGLVFTMEITCYSACTIKMSLESGVTKPNKQWILPIEIDSEPMVLAGNTEDAWRHKYFPSQGGKLRELGSKTIFAKITILLTFNTYRGRLPNSVFIKLISLEGLQRLPLLHPLSETGTSRVLVIVQY